MGYETRMMVATRPLRYGRRDLRAGDTFGCPVVDANYLVRAGKAEPAAVAPPEVVTAPVVVAPPQAATFPDVAGHRFVPAEVPTDAAGSRQAAPEEASEGVSTTPTPRRSYTRRRSPSSWSSEPGSTE